MQVIVILFVAAIAAGPLWCAIWYRRKKKKRELKPGATWFIVAVGLISGWVGSTYLYMMSTPRDSLPRFLTYALFVVVALAMICALTGSTIHWNSQRTARRRNIELGLDAGRAWWPTWLVWAITIFFAPLAVVLAGMLVTFIIDAHSSMSQEDIDSYIFPTLIAAGAVEAVGLIYVMFVRDWLKSRETQRLTQANRTHLAAPQPPPPTNPTSTPGSK
ncbi:MAG: hypothetical protein INR66_24800 [Gordonia polyisoprenivorans]|nr:hypothetical protein [Gordonia polyisoprenivorans]